MNERSNRGRVGLGLIGLGSAWERPYRDILLKMQHRLAIRNVFDPVEVRAQSIAAEFDADAVGSLYQILHRPNLQGFIVLDPGWMGSGAMSIIAAAGKPVFLAAQLLRRTVELRDFVATASSSKRLTDPDELMLPELGLRFTPASCRLRELIATRLGPVHHIEIECNPDADQESKAFLIDWCSDIMGQGPTTWEHSEASAKMKSGIRLSYSPAKSIHGERGAFIKSAAKSSGTYLIRVECDHGHATVDGRARIAWQNSSAANDETLMDERSETEILIDQFCRRVAGGLNPVGRLSEYLSALDISEGLRS
jgi:hypothetical protein